jgi:tRNA/tmRNA/rRNA uracil-C5-methylase (TrmA/RlmC/RlmD family)
MNKRIKKIVYVSCNPETLARDIQYLSSMYEVNYVQPVDMFPMTAHVETIVGLYRK